MNTFIRLSIIVLAAAPLCGCGTYVPHIGEAWEADYPGDPNPKDNPTPPVSAGGQLEFEIKKNIYCELRDAVAAVDHYKLSTSIIDKTVNSRLLPDDWGASVALSIQADENSALNASLSFITPFSAATSRTVGLGATLSSTATRIDKFNSFFTVGYLRDKTGLAVHEICENPAKDTFRQIGVEPAHSSFLTSELGLAQWLIDALIVDQHIPSYGTPDPIEPKAIAAAAKKKLKPAKPAKAASTDTKGQDSISIEIKFVVVSNGNVNPSWKLVRVAADTGSSPLLGAGRTRTHDLILTIGPRGTQTDFANLALQIGQAINGSRTAPVSSSLLPF